MSAQQSIPTFEEIREMFRRASKRMRKTERLIQEVALQQAKTERTVKRVSRDIGRLGGRIGDIIEHMVGGGNIVKQFQALDYDVTAHYRNKIFGQSTQNYSEIDLILEDGDVSILISVKTKLTTEYVHEHIEQLEKYRCYIL